MDTRGWIHSIEKTIDAKDSNAFADFITEDGIFRFGNQPEVKGRKAIADYVAAFFSMIKSSQHKLVNVWDNKDSITWQGQVTYTRLDGKQVMVNFVNIFYMKDKLISDYLIYIDNSPLFAE